MKVNSGLAYAQLRTGSIAVKPQNRAQPKILKYCSSSTLNSPRESQLNDNQVSFEISEVKEESSEATKKAGNSRRYNLTELDARVSSRPITSDKSSVKLLPSVYPCSDRTSTEGGNSRRRATATAASFCE